MYNDMSRDNLENTKDYLWLNLRDLPYFRALLRAVEARYYPQIELPSPTLDIGCGDGHFVTTAFDHTIDVGIDPAHASLREALQRKGYRALLQSEGAHLPFPSAYFNSAFSNSVLEHIPGLDEVIIEIGRVLKPGAPFAFCVPNHNFLAGLSIGQWLDQIKLHSLSKVYKTFFNRIARHEHCDPPEVWQQRLDAAGFDIERWWHYYPPAAMHVTEWGHYFGLPSLLVRKVTGRWILVPRRWNLWPIYRLIEKHYLSTPESDNGVCTFYIARRKN
jgi:SAM-dependent methyltransferase